MVEDIRKILDQQARITGEHSGYRRQPSSYDTPEIRLTNTLLPSLVAAAGAVLITASPALPWLHITAPFLGSMNFSMLDLMRAMDSGGLLVFVWTAFIAGGLSVILSLAVRNRRVGRFVPALTGFAATGYGLYILIEGARTFGEAKPGSEKFIQFSMGVGFWALLGGGLILAIGALMPPYPRH